MIGFLVCTIAFIIMSFSNALDMINFKENAKSLLYLAQDHTGAMPAMDFGYLESQKAEFNVFMATME